MDQQGTITKRKNVSAARRIRRTRHNEDDQRVFYCDYCDVFVSTRRGTRMQHLQGKAHMSNMEAYYRKIQATVKDTVQREADYKELVEGTVIDNPILDPTLGKSLSWTGLVGPSSQQRYVEGGRVAYRTVRVAPPSSSEEEEDEEEEERYRRRRRQDDAPQPPEEGPRVGSSLAAPLPLTTTRTSSGVTVQIGGTSSSSSLSAPSLLSAPPPPSSSGGESLLPPPPSIRIGGVLITPHPLT